jgi:hypothetical protein
MLPKSEKIMKQKKIQSLHCTFKFRAHNSLRIFATGKGVFANQ